MDSLTRTLIAIRISLMGTIQLFILFYWKRNTHHWSRQATTSWNIAVICGSYMDNCTLLRIQDSCQLSIDIFQRII